MLILHGTSLPSILYYIRLTLFAIFFLAFGYAINDFSDREIDRRVGKTNAIAELPSKAGITILAGLFIVGFAWLPVKNLRSINLAALAYFFIIFYSMPPIRFKERGVLGLIVAAASQRTLPALLFFDAYNHWQLDTMLLSLLFLFIGLRWIMGHQLWDFENDLRSGVKTYATATGKSRLEHLLAYLIFPIEAGLLIASSLLYFAKMPWLTTLLIGYFLGLVFAIHRRLRSGLSSTVFSADWIPLADFYFIVWPLCLVARLALEEPFFWMIFLGNVIWQHWQILNHFPKAQRWMISRNERQKRL